MLVVPTTVLVFVSAEETQATERRRAKADLIRFMMVCFDLIVTTIIDLVTFEICESCCDEKVNHNNAFAMHQLVMHSDAFDTRSCFLLNVESCAWSCWPVTLPCWMLVFAWLS